MFSLSLKIDFSKYFMIWMMSCGRIVAGVSFILRLIMIEIKPQINWGQTKAVQDQI